MTEFAGQSVHTAGELAVYKNSRAQSFRYRHHHQVAAPVHDAFWILAPLETIDNTLSQMGEIMQKASLAVTGGLHIDSEIAADVRWPKCLGDVREQKDKGYATWHEINRLITEGLVQRA